MLWVPPVVPLAMSMVGELSPPPPPVGHGDVILEVLSDRYLSYLVAFTEIGELVLAILWVAQPVGPPLPPPFATKAS